MRASLVLILLFLVHCARSPLKNADQALKLVTKKITLKDDQNLDLLKTAIEQSALALEKNAGVLKFGSMTISKEVYAAQLKNLLKVPNDQLVSEIQNHFDFYEVYGERRLGEVFVTSYFEPVLEASVKPSKRLSQALYQAPKDLISIDSKSFHERFSYFDDQFKLSFLKGRLLQPEMRLVPFYNRKEIDQDLNLKNQNLEIGYVDPVDAFTVQIQGSGTLIFQNQKKIRIGYANQNGYPYVAIGKFLLDRIPLEKMTLQTIEAALHDMTNQERQAIMNKNPSYVFFKIMDGDPKTFFGIPAVEGRTIATDQRYFPKGALAFLDFPANEIPSRLVIDADTGGAIKGAGRVDLFAGRGVESKKFAGQIKNRGRLYYLVPK